MWASGSVIAPSVPRLSPPPLPHSLSAALVRGLREDTDKQQPDLVITRAGRGGRSAIVMGKGCKRVQGGQVIVRIKRKYTEGLEEEERVRTEREGWRGTRGPRQPTVTERRGAAAGWG